MISVDDEVQALDAMDIRTLREAWKTRFGGPPPDFRAPDLLRRLFAERLQQEAGGMDPDLDRRIAALVRGYFSGEKVKAGRDRFRPGAVLEREYGGKLHRVDVVDGGFRFRGRTWKSLSQIARDITGTRWNGPRFFGLRERRAA